MGKVERIDGVRGLSVEEGKRVAEDRCKMEGGSDEGWKIECA